MSVSRLLPRPRLIAAAWCLAGLPARAELEAAGFSGDRLGKLAARAAEQFPRFAETQTQVNEKSRWSGMLVPQGPGVIPAGGDVTRDVTAYDNVVALVETTGTGGGGTGRLFVGSLIRCGKAWKPIDLPQVLGPGGDIAAADGFFGKERTVNDSSSSNIDRAGGPLTVREAVPDPVVVSDERTVQRHVRKRLDGDCWPLLGRVAATDAVAATEVAWPDAYGAALRGNFNFQPVRSRAFNPPVGRMGHGLRMLIRGYAPPSDTPRGLFPNSLMSTGTETGKESPPYSPDLNPIELVFSKFKWLLRSASARTVEPLWQVCGEVLDRFTEAECRNCFQHCGYRYT